MSACMDPVRVLELYVIIADRFPISACSRGILSSWHLC